MRLLRSLTAGLALLVIVPVAAKAQEGRLFNDSWFWGLGGGTQTYWTSAVAHASAPVVSLDWLITRTHWALELGFDQAFFTANNLNYTDVGRLYSDTTYTSYRDIAYYAQASARNSRTLSASLMVFPGSGPLRPYAGIGVAANWVQGSVTTSAAPALVPANLWFPNYYGDTYRDQASNFITPIITFGLQAQLSRFSVYGQAKIFPLAYGSYNPLLFTDQGFIMLQAGIRVNVMSLEKM
jgi:hypothetical protein